MSKHPSIGLRRGARIAGLLAAIACTGPALAQHAAPSIITMPADQPAAIVVPAANGRPVRIAVTVDRATIASAATGNARSIEIVGRRGDHILEVLDTYPSKPQGAGRCQAGTETYFRVLDTAARRQRFARLVDSCVVDGVAAADPLITRSDEGGEVTLHGLYASVTLRIGDDGTVTAMPSNDAETKNPAGAGPTGSSFSS
ncbi:hypothetical protein ACBY01_15850 [Sphingomonas sp. ac-8]|uniref:hypothetical protein n=1 Tax=Sphingomonas sp. ac-8 TaxID=3242977 RepID=UPI003A805B9C